MAAYTLLLVLAHIVLLDLFRKTHFTDFVTTTMEEYHRGIRHSKL